MNQKSQITKITLGLEDALGSTLLNTVHLSVRPEGFFLHTVGTDCVYCADTRWGHWLAPRRMNTILLAALEFKSEWGDAHTTRGRLGTRGPTPTSVSLQDICLLSRMVSGQSHFTLQLLTLSCFCWTHTAHVCTEDASLSHFKVLPFWSIHRCSVLPSDPWHSSDGHSRILSEPAIWVIASNYLWPTKTYQSCVPDVLRP